MRGDYEDEWDDGYCSECQGEGEIPVAICVGQLRQRWKARKREGGEMSNTGVQEGREKSCSYCGWDDGKHTFDCSNRISGDAYHISPKQQEKESERVEFSEETRKLCIEIFDLRKERDAALQRVKELEKRVAELEETPCPNNRMGHFFDAKGFCSYCGVYDSINDLKLKSEVSDGQ